MTFAEQSFIFFPLFWAKIARYVLYDPPVGGKDKIALSWPLETAKKKPLSNRFTKINQIVVLKYASRIST